MKRLEEAVTLYRQAAEIYANLPDLRSEGLARGNLANTLLVLKRYDEARRELLRAIECRKPFSHAAEPWTIWAILHNLEQATGNMQAAAEARGQAMASYLAYRRAGGESRADTAPLYSLVAQAVEQGTTIEAIARLAEYVKPDNYVWFKTLLDKLQAVVCGDRDPALADDSALPFWDAIELQLLLERLGAK